MAEYRLETPISEEEVRRLKVGDILYVTGLTLTARDAAHKRAIKYYEEGKELPVSFKDIILYHCGPIVKRIDDEWRIISAGPTTSTRMEYIEYRFIEYFRPRVIIGKGGMGEKTLEALSKYGVVYTIFPGGLGAKAAESIVRVDGVEWLDLGTPEAIWILRVKDFGPLIVTMDTHGRSLHRDIEEESREMLRKILGK